jgi:hypothetical protein
MGVLGTIVEPTAGPVPHVGQDLAPGDAVAAQPVGDDALRLLLQSGQQALEEALGRGRPPLHQDVEHDPVLVYRAPEVVQHTVDPQVHLILSAKSPAFSTARIAAGNRSAVIAWDRISSAKHP